MPSPAEFPKGSRSGKVQEAGVGDGVIVGVGGGSVTVNMAGSFEGGRVAEGKIAAGSGLGGWVASAKPAGSESEALAGSFVVSQGDSDSAIPRRYCHCLMVS